MKALCRLKFAALVIVTVVVAQFSFAATITMYAFKGAHKNMSPSTGEMSPLEKLIRFGHVAFSLDHGKTIFGFGPDRRTGTSPCD